MIHQTGIRRESAVSQPWNCRRLFFPPSGSDVKNALFDIVHPWNPFEDHHVVLCGPVQNERNGISLRRNYLVFDHIRKKGNVLM